MSDLTLQINLSPGDAAYAELTVPRLLAAHPDVAERLLVVDLCKPQRTRIVDPEKRFPEPAYSQRVSKVSEFAEHCLKTRVVDRIVWLREDDAALRTHLSRRYLGGWVRETHDYGGCALMAYLAAMDCPTTRWVIHYDADMALHQAPGIDWARLAVTAMEDEPALVSATPRMAPPVPGLDAPTRHESLDNAPVSGGWRNTWFSTRCFLLDRTRLAPLLPLLRGRIWWETMLARLRGRGYPRSPEVMLFKRLTAAGCARLVLSEPGAWLLHPTRKDEAWLAALPRLLAWIADDRVPDAQRGCADIDLAAWRPWLDSSTHATS